MRHGDTVIVMARRWPFIVKLALWTVCFTVLIAAVGVTSHYWQFGCRTSTWGSTIINGDVVIARWTALPPESEGFFVGDLDWRLLSRPYRSAIQIRHKAYHLWYYFFVYLLPLSALLLIVAMSRSLSLATCRKVGWAGVVGCLFLAATWLISFRMILYVAPWKGEYFVMDGNLRASPAGRRGYFDAAIHENAHPARKRLVFPVENPYFWRLGEPCVFNVPLWIPGAVVIAGAVVLLCRKSRDRFCRNCQYDLTGNTSGICPECGTRVDRVS
jgi:hypothetical protein